MNKPILAFGLIAVFCLASIVNNQFQGSMFVLTVYGADSYGNDITHIHVYQGGSLLVNFTTTGGSQRINDSVSIHFEVYVKINSSLVSSEAEAISYTRVNMSIMNVNTTYIWNNVALNSSGTATLIGSYYYHQKYGDWTSSLPVAGATYNCSVVYQAYF